MWAHALGTDVTTTGNSLGRTGVARIFRRLEHRGLIEPWPDVAHVRTVCRVSEETDGTPFEGFPVAASEFYQQLTVHNTREFWTAHRDVYDTAVRRPMLALTQELSAEFGQFKVFRPNRDVRFSKDKSPYKTPRRGHRG